jgi:uncharacterized membrane protein
MLYYARRTARRLIAHLQGSPYASLAARQMRAARTRLRPAWRLVWRSVWNLGAALGRRLRPADPLPPFEGRSARIGLGVVTLAALGFVVFFCAYLFAAHDAYQTHAEDMGIMTQALWNTTHGAPLHQTICDPVNDTNCLGDVSRLAVHFEPIMFLLAAIYAVFPSPKTLQVVQVLVVAAGAFPAYGIAVRRLRSAAAGVLFAVLYLLSPALDSAVTFDFHAVTLAAPLLLFALYFLLTRNSWGFLIACGLAITTKEEVALTVVMLGLYAALIQRRWRFGGSVALAALGWIVMESLVMRAISPIGHSPMASRYAAFGDSPLAIAVGILTHPLLLGQYLLDPGRIGYLGALLAPLAFFALASPLLLLVAAPAIALNMLSSWPFMYSGAGQYNAEIVPVMLVAAIDGIARLSAFGARLLPRLRAGLRSLAWRAQAQPTLLSLLVGIALGGLSAARQSVAYQWTRMQEWHRSARGRPMRRAPAGPAVALTLALALVAVVADLGAQQRLGFLPLGRDFTWPQTTAHTRLADTLIQRIPSGASVSAQSDLAPHLSNRRFVYLFPSGAQDADYIFLDVTGNPYPLMIESEYAAQVRAALRSGSYQIVAAQDGYLLLERVSLCSSAPAAPASQTAQLPASFYSFTTTSSATMTHQLRGVAFEAGDALVQLVGYDVAPSPTMYLNNASLNVTTYWRVTGQLSQAVEPEIEVTYPSGYTASFTSFPATEWLPMASWPADVIMVVKSGALSLPRQEPGTVRVGVRLRSVKSASASVALPARSIRAFAAGDLRTQIQLSSPLDAPASPVAIGENQTLVSFAQEMVTP